MATASPLNDHRRGVWVPAQGRNNGCSAKIAKIHAFGWSQAVAADIIIVHFYCRPSAFYRVRIMPVKIFWDQPKRVANIAKHGVDFAALTEDFFADALVISAKSNRYLVSSPSCS